MIQKTDLRTGNHLKYYIGEEGVAWDATKIDWQDIKWCEENNENFNDVNKGIDITTTILVMSGFTEDNNGSFWYNLQPHYLELNVGADGFYPPIYDLKDKSGNRIFANNNCLPCKNWNKKNFAAGNEYYPEKMKPAIELQNELQNKFWGRTDVDIYTRFDKQEWETNDEGQTCEHCAFD